MPLRIVDLATPGTNFAGNAGAWRPVGRFILFIDSDNVASPQWLGEMAEAADHADAVSGALDRTKFTASRYTLPGRGITTGLTPWSGFLPFARGANFGVRASVFRELRGFDTTRGSA